MLFFFSANLYYSSTSPYSKMLTPQHQPPNLREVPTFYTPMHFQEIHRLSRAPFSSAEGRAGSRAAGLTQANDPYDLQPQASSSKHQLVHSGGFQVLHCLLHVVNTTSVCKALLAGVQYLTEMLDAHRNFSHSSNIILLGFCLFSPFTFASTKLLPFPPIFYIQTLETETMSLQNTQFSVLAMSFYSHPLNSSSGKLSL